MSTVSMVFFLAAWFLAGFVNGLAGMGAAMVALPLVAALIEPAALVPSTCLVVTVLTIYMAWAYWRDFYFSDIVPLLVGCLPGTAAGLLILLILPPIALQLIIGLAMVSFVAWQIFYKQKKIHAPTWPAGLVAGGATGLMNTATSFVNPPIAMYALHVGWNKESTIGNMNVLALASCLITCAAQASAGLYTPEVLWAALWAAPISLAGQISASPLLRRVNVLFFRKIVLVVIACGGLLSVIRSLRILLS
ncbi:MAG: sulfite exporter TauE/SafE family protein [Desulfobulbaceae bacterium]|nr:sulfite exporter TauE/SafE family protein [Desulfobulbaceae bacterium]